MRITIEPTDPDNHELARPHYRVSIDVPCDNQTVDEMFGMFRSALIGVGYDSEAVDNYLKEQ